MNPIIKEETIHYVARFLERWADKAPNKEHEKVANEIREVSDYLLENLYRPISVIVTRKPKKE